MSADPRCNQVQLPLGVVGSTDYRVAPGRGIDCHWTVRGDRCSFLDINVTGFSDEGEDTP